MWVSFKSSSCYEFVHVVGLQSGYLMGPEKSGRRERRERNLSSESTSLRRVRLQESLTLERGSVWMLSRTDLHLFFAVSTWPFEFEAGKERALSFFVLLQLAISHPRFWSMYENNSYGIFHLNGDWDLV